MCGICGIVGSPDPAVLRRMRDRLAHRGPDDEGEYLSADAALGFRRLSIIDLEGGHQPMRGCRDLHLVFNGEIYNYRELRAKISHPFRTNTDSEVILHLYEEKGPDCVRDLQGMFAFAIWDADHRTLFAARDRLGKKPFVYWTDGKTFAFASEIAALLEAGMERRLDPDALSEYLTYLVVPEPRTMLQGIRKLSPAHTLTWNGSLKVRRYWEPAPSGDPERVREVVTRAVKKRLVADVPIGAFLSGGIDSTIVAGLMAKEGPTRTYSIGFREEKYSELPYAREAASRFGTEHHEFVVSAESEEVLPLLIERYGEPFGDSSMIPTYFVSRETAKHVKVALSGDGGDESFAGYLRHEAIAKLSKYRKIPAPVLSAAAALFPSSTGRGERIRRLLKSSKRPLAELYLDLVTFFTPEMKEELGIRGDASARILEPFARFEDPVSAAGYTDLVTYLPDDILVKVDIASMANGLEVRCPFLDPEVVELGLAIPSKLKRGKAILKKAFADLLPPKIRSRKKMGFSIPLAEWLRGRWRGLLEDTLLGPLRGPFQREAVGRLVREHLAGTRDHRDRLWLLLMFELWARRFL